MEKVKVALVHDWLTGRRGGEKFLEVLAELYPEAPIYTLLRIPGSQHPSLEAREIRTSFIQRMPFLKKRYRWYLPLFPLAAELFDLQESDFIISSSHCVAKGVIPRPGALHVSYIHSPMRYAWNQYYAYFHPDKLGMISRRLIPPRIHRLRIWDTVSCHRVDHFAANSRTVAQRIKRYYGRAADVIPPPVDAGFFRPGGEAGDYFLIVSALVPYKRIDVAVEAFRDRGEELRIVGQGPDFKALRRRAPSNVRFLGAVRDEELRSLYQGARAFILPGEEDFGITVLESQACGVPVIALARGGATETILPDRTGVLYPDPSAEGLRAALDKFRTMTFNIQEIRANAERFARPVFKSRISAYLQEKWAEFQGKT